MNESEASQKTMNEGHARTSGNRKRAMAGFVIAIGVFVLGCILGLRKERTTSIDVSELTDRIAVVQSSVDSLKRSLGEPRRSSSTDEPDRCGSAIAKARELEKSGDHVRAGYYWRNAVEHASDNDLLDVLKEYAEAVFKAAPGEDRIAEAAILERLAELALVRVEPGKMDDAFALRDKCAQFRTSLFAESAANEDVEDITDEGPSAAIEAVGKLLDELDREVVSYAELLVAGKTAEVAEKECLILQLSGVAESAMSQLWFLDRSNLEKAETDRINGFPKRLVDAIDRFNASHDAPILQVIQTIATANPPKAMSSAPHQRNVEFYTGQVARVTAEVRRIRGTDAQTEVQQSVAAIMEKVANEKRQQMNEYQKFVANCCKLAFDSWDVMNTGPSGFGRLPKNKGFKNESEFIKKYVRDFARSISLAELTNEDDYDSIYKADVLISQALQRSSGGPNYWDVKNEHKAFIVTAIYGFYRIDQSLLTPETSRLFNDTFGKYYDKMDEARKVLSVRWMVEEPKIRLEDF